MASDIVPSRVWAEAKMDDSAEVDAKYCMDVIWCFLGELKNAEARIRLPLLTKVAKAAYCAFLIRMLKRKGSFLWLLKIKQHFVQTPHLKVLCQVISQPNWHAQNLLLLISNFHTLKN
ncbi:Uncharacterised protein r2_g3165 [Pycnogonum litorale]